MPSERVQRRIDRLLDEIDQAEADRDWGSVRNLAESVLDVDTDNAEATAYLTAANRWLGSAESGGDPNPPAKTDHAADTSVTPKSFASGRYTVSKFLGEGGKKRVYLAHDNTLDRDVAFALIKTEGLDETSRERVKREAQAMGRMGTHPCIMPIYDLGDEAGQPFMVQPLMGGGDVEELIENADGPLPLEDAIRIATQTAQGLGFAHGKGIVHRDLKPGNVWLDEDGAAKIGDFGLAVAIDRSRLTVEKVMVGTVNYMPPEQATGGEVTPMADLYSLGATLYEMCTGRVPFMSDDEIGIISQHINTPPVAPSWHNSSIPKTLDSLILRLLAKDPAERPESADEVLSALSGIDLSAVEQSEGRETSLDSMAGGVFVGRHKEMDQLKAAFEEVLSGHGRMVTLVGEPGIGKTRTAQELATYAAMRGAQVLWGRSYESGGAPPYWPWVQAMRSHVSSASAESLRGDMGSTASVIAEVVTDVKEKLPGLPEPMPIDDPESARFRLFDAIATFLKQASSSTPLVLMLEDLHWADKPSLMLLEFVARELANSKILIVGNYRDIELNRRHPLSVTLGDLTRERLFDRILLRGLQKHDVARFIEIAAGITPPPALVDTVFQQTEGNPLFVTETVRLLIQEGDIASGRKTEGGTTSWEIRIPEGVREVIGRRLDRLSERCNEVLTIAAVIGRQFRFDVLKMLMEDTTDGQMLDAIDDAFSARVIEELDEVGLYQFTHASMQETLTEELSLTRRVRLHARISEALEEYYGDAADENAAELVEHFAEAETVLGPEGLVRYGLNAGHAALSGFAYESAQRQFLRVIKAAGETLDAVTKAEALHGLARCEIATSERESMSSAVASLRQAFDSYMDAGQTQKALYVALTDIPNFTGLTGVVSLLEEAMKLVQENSQEAGRLLTKYGEFLFEERSNGEQGLEVLDTALAIAARESDSDLELRTLVVSASINGYHLNNDARYEQSLRAAELASDTNNIGATIRAHQYAAGMLMGMGQLSESRQHASQARSMADKLNSRFWISDAGFYSQLIEMETGQWDAARRYSDKAIEAQPNHARNLSSRALIEYSTGDFESARDYLYRTQDSSLRYWFWVGPTLWDLRSLVNELPDSQGWMSDLKTALRERTSTPPSVRKVMHIALGRLAIKADDKKVVQEQYSELERLTTPGFLVSGVPGLYEHDERILGEFASALGDYSKAYDHFEAALTHCRACGFGPEQGRTCSDYSEMLLDRSAPGDREKAIELQDEAIAIATELGMKPLLERVLAKREILKA